MFEYKNNKNQGLIRSSSGPQGHADLITCETHYDLLLRNHQEISDLFTQLGGRSPEPSEFRDSHSWIYCKTEDRKDKGKIGYQCHFKYTDKQRPFILITVHSFKGGGEALTFNSLKNQSNTYKHALTHNTSIQTSVEIPKSSKFEEALSDASKLQKFLYYLEQWECGDTDVKEHPYVQKKQLWKTKPLRRVGEAISYRILSPTDETTQGIQLIYPNGNKIIYGHKKGGFAVLGALELAETLYLCEGYATGNAIAHLADSKRPRAIVIAIDAGNLPIVAQHLKQKYPNKRLIICPDNDHETHSHGKGNPGLLKGFETAILTHSEIKIPNPAYGSDWCDFWLAHPSEAQSAFRKQNPFNIRQYSLETLKALSPKNSNTTLYKALFKTIKRLIKNYPFDSERVILAELTEALKHTPITHKQVRDAWAKMKRKQFALALRDRSFSVESTENYCVKQVSSVSAIFKETEHLKKIHPKAVFITNAPMGSGKTEHFMKPHFKADEAQALRPTVITPNRTLTQGIASRFNAFHYQEEVEATHAQTLPFSLAITINSIIKQKHQDFLMKARSLFIDEYTQIIKGIVTGTVKRDQKQATERRLSKLMQQANYLYIADADLHQVSIDHIKKIVGNKTPIFVFTLDRKDAIDTRYNITTHTSASKALIGLFQKVKASLEKNEKLYVVTDSKKQAEGLVALLAQEKQLNPKILTLSSETVNFDDPENFLKNPNDYLTQHKPDLVIATPAVSSGLSIEIPYFNRVSALYTGTVTPTVFQQMMHRIRTQKVFEIELLTKKSYMLQEIQDPAEILMNTYNQHISQFGKHQRHYDPETGVTSIGSLELQLDNGKLVISGDPHYLQYEELSAHMISLQRQQLQQSQQFVVLQAMARGISVRINEDACDLLEDPKGHLTVETVRHVMGAIKENKCEELSGEDTLAELEYLKLRNKGPKTPEELILMKRHKIAKDLNVATVTPEDVDFFDKGGVVAVENYKLMREGVHKAHEMDDQDRRWGVAKIDAQGRAYKVKLLYKIFENLGIDMKTGEGTYTKEEACLVRMGIAQDEVLSQFILFKLHLRVSSTLPDVSFVNKLLKKLLLVKATRLQVREGEGRTWFYRLDPKSFERLSRYIRINEKVHYEEIYG